MARTPPRADLSELRRRKTLLRDEARPEKLARRRAEGRLTARECLDRLVAPGSFVEYGGHVIAAQRARRSLDDLLVATAGDGVIAGLADVNAGIVERPAAALLSYDYLVLAGTQGGAGHHKTDRFLDVMQRTRRPLVFFAEGGGGRPGDTDVATVAGLNLWTFHSFARLSGHLPTVGVAAGYCFAGNAALYGMCDITIATTGSSIGMGGPAMIEGGGLGIFRPEEVGPTDVQAPNGVIDVLVDDEQEAVAVAQKYLSYFQGPVTAFECADQRLLRSVIPENRLRVYDVRSVIELLADTGSVLELRRQFGLGMVTAFIRIEGRPVGVVANNPVH
ncbi:MAG: carboxyl transferase domain-containing protein, partial [Mycobacteriales bacterium]